MTREVLIRLPEVLADDGEIGLLLARIKQLGGDAVHITYGVDFGPQEHHIPAECMAGLWDCRMPIGTPIDKSKLINFPTNGTSAPDSLEEAVEDYCAKQSGTEDESSATETPFVVNDEWGYFRTALGLDLEPPPYERSFGSEPEPSLDHLGPRERRWLRSLAETSEGQSAEELPEVDTWLGRKEAN